MNGQSDREFVGKVTHVSLVLGKAEHSCEFSIRDTVTKKTVDFCLNSTDPGVLHRFFGMSQLVQAALQSNLNVRVFASKSTFKQDRKLAVEIEVQVQPAAKDDAEKTTFVGRIPRLVSINGEGPNSAQCLISFAPDVPGESGTWRVDWPFTHLASALIAALVSQGRVELYQRHEVNPPSPLARAAKISIGKGT